MCRSRLGPRGLGRNAHLLRPWIGPNGVRNNLLADKLEPCPIDDVVRNAPNDPADSVDLTNMHTHITDGLRFLEATDIEHLFYRARYSAKLLHPPAPIAVRDR